MASKPYFSKDQEDSIIAVFIQQIVADGGSFDDNYDRALREYIQASKNDYENNILWSVLDGEYLCTVKGDEVAFKPSPPSKSDVDDIAKFAEEAANGDKAKIPTRGQIEQSILMQRAHKLSHALNMVYLKGKILKLKIHAQ